MQLSNKLSSFFLLITIFSISSVNAKIVALDLMSIYEDYSLVKEANQVIDEAESRFKRIIATADVEIKELEKKANEAEVLKKKEEIQDIVDDEVEALHDQKDLYNTSINRNIQKTLDTMAKEKGYELILDKSFILADIEDVSAEFISRLEKNTTSLKSVKAQPAKTPAKAQ